VGSKIALYIVTYNETSVPLTKEIKMKKDNVETIILKNFGTFF